VSPAEPFLRLFSEIESVGQVLMQSLQPTHLAASILISNGLMQLVTDCIAPNGQNKEHCVLFLLRSGNMITSAANKERKIIVFIREAASVMGSYSVTVLKGQSHEQYVG